MCMCYTSRNFHYLPIILETFASKAQNYDAIVTIRGCTIFVYGLVTRTNCYGSVLQERCLVLIGQMLVKEKEFSLEVRTEGHDNQDDSIPTFKPHRLFHII